jgi:DNA polymerase-3 subunit delta
MSDVLSDLKPVYLIYGSEELLLEQAVNRLKKRFAEVGDLDYNMKVFDGESAEGYEIVAAANTLPFMSERLLVVVRRADKLKTDDLNVIADYAADPNPATSLVLVAEKIAKNMRIYKAIDKLHGVAEYKAPSKREYPKKVVEMFADHGKRIGVEGAEVLVRAVGFDLRRLDIEIEKVVAFTGEDATLSRDDIEAVMSTTAPTSIFDFLDALGARDCRMALRQLSDLLGEGESVYGIVAMSLRHTRNLISVRALLDREESLSDGAIAKEIGAPPWLIKNLSRQAARFTEAELVQLLRDAAAMDREMKTSREPRLAFERWIVSACGS